MTIVILSFTLLEAFTSGTKFNHSSGLAEERILGGHDISSLITRKVKVAKEDQAEMTQQEEK